MARIAGINIPAQKHIVIALTAIYGIGITGARRICETTGIAPELKVKDLKEKELESLRTEVAKYNIEGDLRREVAMNIKRFRQMLVPVKVLDGP